MDKEYSQITNNKFDGNNWQRWKFQITTVLKAKNVFQHVEQDIDEPADRTKPEWAEWSTKRNKAMAILSSTIADDQLDHIITCTKPSEIWVTLHSINEQASSACKSGLLHEFFTYSYQEGDTMVHLTKIKNIAAKLEGVKEKQSEAAIVSRIISTLPERFSAFISAWKMQKETDKTLLNLTARLSEEEMTYVQRDKTMAFSVNKMRTVQKTKSRPVNEKRGKCYICGSTKHFKRNCPKNKENGENGQGHKKEKQNQSIYNETAASASAWSAEIDEKASRKLLSNATDSWIVDCGATHHMTPRQDWFETMKAYSAKIKLANGSFTMAKGQGTIRLKLLYKGKWTEKLLINVLWVPELPRSLFSSGAAADRGCETVTKGDQMTLGSNNVLIGEAIRKKGGLYQLNMRVIKPEYTAFSCVKPTDGEKVSDDLMLTHQRLNHMSLAKMKQMEKLGLITLKTPTNDKLKLFCEACIYGKSTRGTHPLGCKWTT